MDATSEIGATPLNYAAATGKSTLALVVRHTTFAIRSRQQSFPRHASASEQGLRGCCCGLTHCCMWPLPGCQESLRLLLAAGASVDASKSTTGSLLLWAISTGKPESFRALIKGGANPNSVNAVGASALAMAASTGKLEMVKDLLDAGAAPKREAGPNGVSALHAAANGGSVDAIRALLEVTKTSRPLSSPHSLRNHRPSSLLPPSLSHWPLFPLL